MQNNNQNSRCANWVSIVVLVGLLIVLLVLFFSSVPKYNEKEEIYSHIPSVVVNSEKPDSSGVILQIEPYKDFSQKPNTIYLIGEREECKKAGGKFYYHFFSDVMTCTKTTYEGNKTITEEIFNYALSND